MTGYHMKNYRCYMFDFDGTLVESERFWQIEYLRVLQSRGYPVTDQDFEALLSLGESDRWPFCRDRFGLTEEQRPTIPELRAQEERFYRTEVTWKPGAKEYLEHLKIQGAETVLFSATAQDLLQEALKRLDGTHLFHRIFSVKDIGIPKSDPESYRYCLNQLGANANDAVMFEDTPYSMKSAKTAGMDVIGVYEPYREHLHPEIDRICDRFVVDLTECIN